MSFSFLTLALAYAIWYSFSVFFVALLNEFHWSRSVGAGAFSLFIIMHGVMGPVVGGMLDRFGPKGVILGGSVCLGIGLALCSFLQTWWQFYIFYGAITAIGVGSIGWVPNTSLIQRWFKEKRGLAMGLISSGIGVGILVCVPCFQLLITHAGWRTAYLLIAVLIPLIIISMTLAFLKKPQKTAQSAETSMTLSRAVERDPLVINKEWASRQWTLRRAITTRIFWLLSLSLILNSYINQSIFAHQVAFFVDHGLSPLIASYIVGIIGIVSVGGKILWGALSDKIGREVTYTLGMICVVLGMIFLILFNSLPVSIFPYCFAFFFSLGYASGSALPPLIAADLFEGGAYGRIYGTLNMINNVGGALGAWFAGFLFDQLGSYLSVFILLIAFSLFSCLNIWWVAPRKIRMVPEKKLNP
ncbi:MAG: MFS transporter [Thermodesulfobacteriota bacterium]